MTKIIAVLNHKGGVGKTTTTINLAAALQQKKKRVLAIDMDGQANLTESFGLSIEEEQTVYGAMKGKYPLPLVETAGGVTVVPSCLDLSAAEAELINEPGRELILSGLIAKSLDHRKFDYILIDCPPSLGLLTLNALTAADYLIIPVQAQFLAMRGMAKIMNVITTVQERLNPKLAIGGIVITQFDKRKTLNLLRAALHGTSVTFSANDCRGVTYVRQVIANLAPALSLPGGVYNFGSSNTENMVHTAQQFAQELDIAVQIEAADWPRNLVMDGKKLEKAGIRFDTTQQGIRHCLRDYGLASR